MSTSRERAKRPASRTGLAILLSLTMSIGILSAAPAQGVENISGRSANFNYSSDSLVLSGDGSVAVASWTLANAVDVRVGFLDGTSNEFLWKTVTSIANARSAPTTVINNSGTAVALTWQGSDQQVRAVNIAINKTSKTATLGTTVNHGGSCSWPDLVISEEGEGSSVVAASWADADCENALVTVGTLTGSALTWGSATEALGYVSPEEDGLYDAKVGISSDGSLLTLGAETGYASYSGLRTVSGVISGLTSRWEATSDLLMSNAILGTQWDVRYTNGAGDTDPVAVFLWTNKGRDGGNGDDHLQYAVNSIPANVDTVNLTWTAMTLWNNNTGDDLSMGAFALAKKANRVLVPVAAAAASPMKVWQGVIMNSEGVITIAWTIGATAFNTGLTDIEISDDGSKASLARIAAGNRAEVIDGDYSAETPTWSTPELVTNADGRAYGAVLAMNSTGTVALSMLTRAICGQGGGAEGQKVQVTYRVGATWRQDTSAASATAPCSLYQALTSSTLVEVGESTTFTTDAPSSKMTAIFVDGVLRQAGLLADLDTDLDWCVLGDASDDVVVTFRVYAEDYVAGVTADPDFAAAHVDSVDSTFVSGTGECGGGGDGGDGGGGPTVPINTMLPLNPVGIVGSLVVGSSLTCVAPAFSEPAVRVDFTWSVGGVAVSSSSVTVAPFTASLTLPAGTPVGTEVSCLVTGVSAGATGTVAASVKTIAPAVAPPAPPTAPTTPVVPGGGTPTTPKPSACTVKASAKAQVFTFASGASRVSPAVRSSIRAAAGRGCEGTFVVTGRVQPTVDKSNDVSLARARAQAVVNVLRPLHPNATFRVVIGRDRLAKDCAAAKNRCATVQFKR
jgi:hypothetical protein